jgi:dTDP-4-dehydrorhamnose 3,5-epimerase
MKRSKIRINIVKEDVGVEAQMNSEKFPTPFLRASLEVHKDERGYFSRLFDRASDSETLQINVAKGEIKGTFRGLHYMEGSSSEEKVIRTLTGSIFDVALDIRLGSPTYGNIFTFTVDTPNVELVIPRHFAHGYLTLEENTLISYRVNNPYVAERDRGFRFDNRQFNLSLPIPISLLSEKDMSLPFFAPGMGEAQCGCC